MTYATLETNFPLDSALNPVNNGVSPESEAVKNSLREVREKNWQSFTRGLCLSDLIDSLVGIHEECSEENWDGYEAKSINPKALLEALSLTLLLPLSFDLPEAIPEPDGSIAFEWYREKRKRFIISVSGNNTIVYAGLFGRINQSHGTERFGDSLPQTISRNIERLFECGE